MLLNLVLSLIAFLLIVNIFLALKAGKKEARNELTELKSSEAPNAILYLNKLPTNPTQLCLIQILCATKINASNEQRKTFSKQAGSF